MVVEVVVEVNMYGMGRPQVWQVLLLHWKLQVDIMPCLSRLCLSFRYAHLMCSWCLLVGLLWCLLVVLWWCCK